MIDKAKMQMAGSYYVREQGWAVWNKIAPQVAEVLGVSVKSVKSYIKDSGKNNGSGKIAYINPHFFESGVKMEQVNEVKVANALVAKIADIKVAKYEKSVTVKRAIEGYEDATICVRLPGYFGNAEGGDFTIIACAIIAYGEELKVRKDAQAKLYAEVMGVLSNYRVGV